MPHAPDPKDLGIGPYKPGEEAEVLDCFRECFAFEPDLYKWRHLYLDNPGGEPIIVVARHVDRIVSHIAILPRRVRAFRKEGLAGHSIDGMTCPEWQRKGIKTMLATEAKRITRQRGILMTYGFSNEQSRHGVLKYERILVGSLPVLVRPLRPVQGGLALAGELLPASLTRVKTADRNTSIPDAAVAGPLPVDVPYAPDAIGSQTGWTPPTFDERHTQLFETAESIPSVSLVRDSAHLTWRYPSDPQSPYLKREIYEGGVVIATAVVRIATLFGVRLMLIMEWLWRQGARSEGIGLVRDVVSLANSAGVHGVTALAMRGTLQRRLLHRHGFLGIPNMLLPKTTLLSVRPEQVDENIARWSEPSNWYLTWGDGFVL